MPAVRWWPAVVVGVVLFLGQPAGADQWGPSLSIEATAVAESGDIVEFEVIAVVSISDWFRGDEPAPGEVLSVHMGGRGTRFIHVGTDYIVPLYDGPSAVFDGYWAELDHVRYADGSTIDTGYPTRDGFELWLVPVLGAAVSAAAFAVYKIFERRHLRRVARDAAAAIAEREGAHA